MSGSRVENFFQTDLDGRSSRMFEKGGPDKKGDWDYKGGPGDYPYFRYRKTLRYQHLTLSPSRGGISLIIFFSIVLSIYHSPIHPKMFLSLTVST